MTTQGLFFSIESDDVSSLEISFVYIEPVNDNCVPEGLKEFPDPTTITSLAEQIWTGLLS